MDDKKKIEWLFQRYLDNDCTPDEIRILLQYFDAGENEELLRSLIHAQSEGIYSPNLISDHASLLNTSYSKIKQSINADSNTKPMSASVVPLYKQFWFRMCAAAVLVFLVSAPAFYFLQQKNETLVVQKENVQSAKDVPPGTNNAVLTLDDGTTIVLDSAANGTLAQQGGMKVLKINGQIAYNQTGTWKGNAKPVYNTITTAKGNQYQLILADGSKVWLNAASSIRFPASFEGNERKVEITGEAYFEVAHDASKPFKVMFNNQSGGTGEIEVLGTHFNVNAYSDEQDIKTTLLEGSVKIKRADKVQTLSPGQQASLTPDAIVLKKDVDLSQVTAWKDGYFLFNNMDIQTIMRQVARWYDVDVNFEGKIPSDGFTGKISRNVPLSKFLKVLELNEVHVKAEGRKVTIMP